MTTPGEMVEPPAFSNGTSWMMWEEQYCNRCWHDRAARNGDYANGCELIALGFAHQPVPQWVGTEADLPPADVHCTKFTPDDGRDGDGPKLPKPRPPAKGQPRMFDADEYVAAPTDVVDRRVEVPA